MPGPDPQTNATRSPQSSPARSAVSANAQHSPTNSQSSPNVLLITTHDTGRHFGCYGYDTLHTPHIDRLASDGIRFTNYFATVPICSASRATMLTGQYPQTHGLMDLVTPGVGWAMRRPDRHLSHVLRNAGYRTRLYGFQHEAADPSVLGFDEIVSPRSDELPPNSATLVAKDVAAFLDSYATDERPFYAQVGFRETHTPFEIGDTKPDESRGVYVPPYLVDDHSSRQAMAAFQGAVRVVDDAVGVISTALERRGAERDTLLIVTTDHGIEVPRSKWTLYDPGVEIAMVMRWPGGGLKGGGTCERLMANVDFVPTLLDIVGVDIPGDAEGVSLAEGLLDPGVPSPRDAVFGLYQKAEMRSVRTDRFKMIQHFDFPTDYLRVPVAMNDVLEKRVVGLVELFDLDADPHEFHNVADKPEYAAIRDELRTHLWEWLERVDDPILRGPTASPSYLLAQNDYRYWRTSREH